MLTVSACKNCLKFGLILSSIKLKTFCQYLSNSKMDIPTAQEILLFRLMICAIVFFLNATYVIALFIDFFFLCVKYMQWFSHNFVCLKHKKSVFRRLYRWLSFSLQRNSSSLLLCSLPYFGALVLKQLFTLQLSWLLKMFSRGTLLACHNYSKLLFLLFFIIYPQYFLSIW